MKNTIIMSNAGKMMILKKINELDETRREKNCENLKNYFTKCENYLNTKDNQGPWNWNLQHEGVKELKVQNCLKTLKLLEKYC